MIILKSLDYFDFKDNGIILSDMLFLVKNFIIFYEEEICTDDLFNILRVYFKDTPSFKELLHQSKSFYDYLFLFIDRAELPKTEFINAFGLGLRTKVQSGLLEIVYAVPKFQNMAIDFAQSKIHLGFELLF